MNESEERARQTRQRMSADDAARGRREQLLSRGWPTAHAVAETLHGDVTTEQVATWRETGVLLGAWSSADSTFVYPDCQFDRDGQPRSVMPLLLALLPARGDPGGWRRVFWLYGPREALGGQTPADWLSQDPDRVLALAQSEFGPLAIHVT